MSSMDLSKEYSILNRKIFDNSLPETIPVKWNNSRTNLGKTRISLNRDGTYDFAITISRFFLCSDKQYTETLIHEMIHVYMAVSGEFRKDGKIHGPLFKKHMNRINRDFPQFQITIKEEGRVNVDISKIPHQNGFLLCTGDRIFFNLLNKDIDESIRKQVIRQIPLAYRIKQGDLYFFQGRYSQLATVPVRRNVKTFIGKLQYLRDRDSMESLRDSILQNHQLHIPLQKKKGMLWNIASF
ncbi:SprT-like domain-containing protein [Spirochaeta isovalerica]|uniref:SprT-like domain-containing protein n=1 Tax=Spirochaeta isovalerica TaxID=150 RepID=A0A841R7K9_9SPIO|nr:SprT-like domain-containing protein [Spirochaeta isovalerica]MBB6478959.1 hypothetical protein [Spirochaeta isovalerica]